MSRHGPLASFRVFLFFYLIHFLSCLLQFLVVIIIIIIQAQLYSSHEIRREKVSLDVNSIWNRKNKILINMVTVITGIINNIS